MSHDTWIHRLVEYGVEPLVRTLVRPNHLTMARLTTGIAAAILFAWGTRDAQFWACGLYILSFLLDRADGILARRQGTITDSGHVFDLVADATSTTLVLIGIGIGLRFSFLGAWASLLGLVAGLAALATFWLIGRADRRTGTYPLASFAGMDADDAMIVIPVAILFNYSIELIAIAAVAMPLFLLSFVIVKRKALWGPLPKQRATPVQQSLRGRSRHRVPPR